MKNVLLPTMTLSESIIVFKRCAIVKTVHCLNFSRMVFWIRLSVLKEYRNTVIHSILVVDILLFLLFINLWIAKSEAFNKKCTYCQWRHFYQPNMLYMTRRFVPWVDICCCFIDHQYVILSKNGSCQTDQLTLTDAEVGSTLRHFRVQLPRKIIHSRLQLNLVLKRYCICHSFALGKDTGVIEK